MFFASDNTSGAHPKVMDAIVAANDGYAMPYGADPIMDEVRDMIRARFEAPQAEVYLVATGSSANALSLACLCPPWATIFAHENSHIEEDECGAPEFFTGGSKITLVGGADAKMSPDALRAAIAHTGRAGVHNVQRGAVSITNATEAGAVYSVSDIAALNAVAEEFDLPVHLDGARFANALVSTNATPAEMTWKAGVDILSFGGTKNGCMGVEAVVIFNPDVHSPWEFELRRKRGGHLFSKHRYLSAQMKAYLTDDLWLTLARHSNAMAQRLSQGILDIDGAKLMHPTMGNQVFAYWPRSGHRTAMDAGAKYYFWPFDQALEGDDNELLSARLVASWSTTEDDVDRFLSLIQG